MPVTAGMRIVCDNCHREHFYMLSEWMEQSKADGWTPILGNQDVSFSLIDWVCRYCATLIAAYRMFGDEDLHCVEGCNHKCPTCEAPITHVQQLTKSCDICKPDMVITRDGKVVSRCSLSY